MNGASNWSTFLCPKFLNPSSKPFGRTTNNLFPPFTEEINHARTLLCAPCLCLCSVETHRRLKMHLAHRRWANALSGHPGMTIGTAPSRMHLIFLLCQTDLFGKIKLTAQILVPQMNLLQRCRSLSRAMQIFRRQI